jgi:hypothetical protein
MMHSNFAFSVLLAIVGTSSAAAVPDPVSLATRGSPTGINNRGSSNCAKGSMKEIVGYINQIPDVEQFEDGFHIACSGVKRAGIQGGGTCAFFQGTNASHNGTQVKALINLLSNHPNTDGCGSVPVSLLPEFGGVNQLSKMGMLTVNYVADTDNPCPPGLCEYPGDSCSAIKSRQAVDPAFQQIVQAANMPKYVPPSLQRDITDWLAIGDSFSAGISADVPNDELNYQCSRFKKSYPSQMNENPRFPGYSTSRTFVFGACSGAKMDEVTSLQIELGEPSGDTYPKIGKPQLGTVSLSGNDLQFGDVSLPYTLLIKYLQTL